jgi:hypothetical protein
MCPGIRTGKTAIVPGISSSARAWTPATALGGETPDYWYKDGTRLGLTMPNAISPGTNDASILLPYLYMNNSEYASVNDNGAMDIVNNLGQVGGTGDVGCTICGVINAELLTKVAAKHFTNKFVAASVVGRWTIWAAATTGYLGFTCQTSGGNPAINSTIDITTLTFSSVAVVINDTQKKIHLFINNTEIGAGVSYTGTFAQMANAYRTYISAYNTATTGAPIGVTGQSCAGFAIYPFILSSDQLTTKYNRGFVAGAKFDYACNDMVLYNSGSVEGYNMTIGFLGTAGSRAANIRYGAYGSRRLLEVGYTKFVNYPNNEAHVAYRDVDTPKLSVLSGYDKVSDNAGVATSHNGADSYLIPTTGIVDRSDVAKVTTLAQLTSFQYYYYLNCKDGLNSIEATNYRIRYYYRSINQFVKRNGQIITDWLIYPTGKTGNDYKKVINWTGEYVEAVFGANMLLSFGMDSVYNHSATHLHIGKAKTELGDFMQLADAIVTGAPTAAIGNTKALALNIDKCNGTLPVVEGEINWIMTYESTWAATLYLAKSYNGLDWEFIMALPDLTPHIAGLGQCDIFVDNDDPSDFNNIHVLTFSPTEGKIYEVHPLNANFTAWSNPVSIFSTGIVQTYNCTVILISGVYHMFYSVVDGDAHHYLHHATATYGAMTATNDWHNDGQTGDWAGLGNCESYSLVNTGGANWVLYYYDITAAKYKYSLTTDNGATWSAGTIITSLSTPLQFSVGVIKLQ